MQKAWIGLGKNKLAGFYTAGVVHQVPGVIFTADAFVWRSGSQISEFTIVTQHSRLADVFRKERMVYHPSCHIIVLSSSLNESMVQQQSTLPYCAVARLFIVLCFGAFTAGGGRDRKEGTARLLCRMCDINYEMGINCESFTTLLLLFTSYGNADGA